MKTSRLLGAVAVVFVLVMAALLARGGGESTTEGPKLYNAKCASCHGKDGSGATAMGKKLKLRDLRSSEVQKQPDQKLYDIIAKGKGKMPPNEKKLTQEQMKDLVAYVRQLAKK